MSLSLGIDIGGTSIKASLLEAGRELWCARSRVYARPDRETLIAALASMLAAAPAEGRAAGRIGVCVPGLLASDGRSIALAVNVPGLVGLEFGELLRRAGVGKIGEGGSCGDVRVVTDAHAAAFDYAEQHRVSGRLLAISIGTGVGACVLDDGVPLLVSGRGPGHLGQMDVSGEDPPGQDAPIGPDGGRGSLEAYIGLPALRARYGEDVEGAIGAMAASDTPCRALVRAIRIAHAVYRPGSIVLLGGIGIRLGGAAPGMHDAACDGLTGLAVKGWTLRCGDSDHHAARGAARLAAHPTT